MGGRVGAPPLPCQGTTGTVQRDRVAQAEVPPGRRQQEWSVHREHGQLPLPGSLSFDEVWNLLKKMNLQLSEKYAKAIFRVGSPGHPGFKAIQESEIESSRDGVLNEQEFLNFFERLTERPELRHVLRLASTDGVETITANELHRFLSEEQGVSEATTHLYGILCSSTTWT